MQFVETNVIKPKSNERAFELLDKNAALFTIYREMGQECKEYRTHQIRTLLTLVAATAAGIGWAISTDLSGLTTWERGLLTAGITVLYVLAFLMTVSKRRHFQKSLYGLCSAETAM